MSFSASTPSAAGTASTGTFFYVAAADGPPRFRRARRWRQADVGALIIRIAARCEAWFSRRGFGTDEEHDDDPDGALPLLQSASAAGRSAVRQCKARRVQKLGEREFALPPLCAASGGYSLPAGVLIEARDRKGLRRLAGYIARPPLVLDRVEALPGDRVRIELKRPWSDGTTAPVRSAEDLAERLVALVPPPWANRVLYGGVLASRHRWHRAVRPQAPNRRVAPAGPSRNHAAIRRARSRLGACAASTRSADPPYATNGLAVTSLPAASTATRVKTVRSARWPSSAARTAARGGGPRAADRGYGATAGLPRCHGMVPAALLSLRRSGRRYAGPPGRRQRVLASWTTARDGRGERRGGFRVERATRRLGDGATAPVRVLHEGSDGAVVWNQCLFQ